MFSGHTVTSQFFSLDAHHVHLYPMNATVSSSLFMRQTIAIPPHALLPQDRIHDLFSSAAPAPTFRFFAFSFSFLLLLSRFFSACIPPLHTSAYRVKNASI